MPTQFTTHDIIERETAVWEVDWLEELRRDDAWQNYTVGMRATIAGNVAQSSRQIVVRLLEALDNPQILERLRYCQRQFDGRHKNRTCQLLQRLTGETFVGISVKNAKKVLADWFARSAENVL